MANIAIWEVRALFYMILTYFVGSQLIRTHRDVWINTWCILIPIYIFYHLNKIKDKLENAISLLRYGFLYKEYTSVYTCI